MKALSIRQPWAWLIVNDIKTVENRTWKTDYRGKFLIHASEKFAMPAKKFAEFRQMLIDAFKEEDIDFDMPENPKDYPTGGIVGSAVLVNCVTECDDEYDQIWHEPGQYAFILDNAETLPFRPLKGKLNFFEVSDFN